MRNMSFMLTKEQIKKRVKTVTRRFGWWFLEPGMLIQPVEQCQGLKKGEKIVKIGGPIEIVSTKAEYGPHFGIDARECALEGFADMPPDEFTRLIQSLQPKGKLYEPCNRIEFRYVNVTGARCCMHACGELGAHSKLKKVSGFLVWAWYCDEHFRGIR